jgi:SAM-dependent methyltransferase
MTKSTQILHLAILFTAAFALSCSSESYRLSQDADAVDYTSFDAALRYIDESMRNVELGDRTADYIAEFEYRIAKKVDLTQDHTLFNESQVRDAKLEIQAELANSQDGLKTTFIRLEEELKKFDVAQLHTNTKLSRRDFGPDGKYFIHGLIWNCILERAGKSAVPFSAVETIPYAGQVEGSALVEKIDGDGIEDYHGLPAVRVYEDQRVFVTGEFFYSVPIVLSNLGLYHWAPSALAESYDVYPAYNEDELRNSKVEVVRPLSSNSRVVSIGEGYSGLVPFLLANGQVAHGLDLVYGAKLDQTIAGYEYMKTYERKFAANLVQGNAADLPTHFKSGKADFVLFHAVFNYLSEDDAAKALAHAFRILKCGGQIRMAPFLNEDSFNKALSRLPDGSYKYAFFSGETRVVVKQAARDRASLPTYSFPWEELQQLLFSPKTGASYPEIFRGQLSAGEDFTQSSKLIIIEKL